MFMKSLHNRWRVALVVLLGAALLGLNTSSLFAQETAEEPPVEIEQVVEQPATEAPTEVPTEAPTEPPAPTDEPLPSVEPPATEVVLTEVVEATAEVTEEATPEVTVPVESTEEITPTDVPVVPTEEGPTLEPEPGLMLVYEDTFANGQSTVWTLASNWVVIPSEAGRVTA